MAFTKEGTHEEEAFLPNRHSDHDYDRPPAQTHWRAPHFIRLLIELAMASTILLLLIRHSSTSCSPLRRTPVPRFPRKIYTFQSNPHYTPDNMFTNQSTTLRALHNWIELSSPSRGYIIAPPNSSLHSTLPPLTHPQSYDLPTPYTIALDRHTSGPGYMVSVFHQLHCLSYLAVHFRQGYDGMPLSDEVAQHAVHCLNYLRQGITCSADVTLEGQTAAGPGEGSEHECVDYEAVLEWAGGEGVVGMRWREGLLPEEGTL
ncbi:hypothetical protein BU23DRAFT_589861 [Bimuria novae-zelandiae CBS 107.79]|uniref:Oxidase ustYa n=1 Tax=Bimuria novae-zelandiae CBS 107.79 TaxID=1447943 RepID=A0A6A5VA87_9PLEO|nr:hypothetical protein BU23DRAFT_589861 [Bimuria novae-zelandiae CBS 107.79]